MKTRFVGVFAVALVLILTACGRVGTGPNAGVSPSPFESPSSLAQPTPLTIPGPTLHNGEVGLAYTPVTYNATGGSQPYTWSVSSGALPGGLNLSTDGIVSGVPTASGTFTFTVEVLDVGMATANLSGAIRIAPRLTVHQVGDMASQNEMEVCVQPGGNNPCPTSDDRYRAFAAASGGTPPYTYALVSGTLPPGTRMNGLALTGSFGTTIGVYRFTVLVTDSMGATATVDAIYNLYRLQPH